MSKDYHGPTPVTDTDIGLGKKHLIQTLVIKKQELALNKKKIAEHDAAGAATSNPKSKAYNADHSQSHRQDNKKIQADIAERQRSLKTLKGLKPDRTYDDVRKAKVGLMNQKAGVQNG